MPRAEARGGMAEGDRAVTRRARAAQALAPREGGLASAQFRLALAQMPRAEGRGASLTNSLNALNLLPN